MRTARRRVSGDEIKSDSLLKRSLYAPRLRTGKIQRHILGLLNRTVRPAAFSPGGEYLTAELHEELHAAGLLSLDAPRKQTMAAVLRACSTLQARGLIEGVYRREDGKPQHTIGWSIAHPTSETQVGTAMEGGE
jgi:hypothetical protein